MVARYAMKKDKIRFIHDSLGEAKEFSKEVRQYLYEIEKQRPLTDMEKALWDKTHRIHVRTEDSRMMIQEQYEEVYPAVALLNIPVLVSVLSGG